MKPIKYDYVFISQIPVFYKINLYNMPIKRKISPIKIRSEAKKISLKRGISIYKVKITSLNNKTVFADGEITHFVPLKFIKKQVD